MAVSYVTSAYNSGGTSPLDTSVAVTAGNALLVHVYWEYDFGAPGTPTSVVWDPAGDNQTLTVVQTQQMDANNRSVAVYRLNSVTSTKTGNVRFTCGSPLSSLGCRVVVVSGHDSTTLLRDSDKSTAGAFSTSTSPRELTLDSASGDLVIGFISNRDELAYLGDGTGQSNYTENNVNSVTSRSVAFATKAGATTSTTVGFTSSQVPPGYDFALIAVTVQPGAAAPSDPSGVTASDETPNSASISWTDNSSDETGFKVRYTPSPYSSYTTATGSVAASPYIITGLTDGTDYKAEVAAFNGAGDSSWIASGVFSTTALTKLRPSADTTAGSWAASSGSVLYTMIDESVADDADYITTSSNTVTKIKLETATDPGSDANHALRIRARSTAGTLTVRLVQGNPGETTIVSWVPSLSSSFATYDYNLTTAEASVITDYSALYVKFTTS